MRYPIGRPENVKLIKLVKKLKKLKSEREAINRELNLLKEKKSLEGISKFARQINEQMISDLLRHLNYVDNEMDLITNEIEIRRAIDY